VPKIITKDKKFFIKLQSLLISNHNSFRVLFDKLLPYILFEKYIYIIALEIAIPENQHCANCIGTLSFPIYEAFVGHARQRHDYSILCIDWLQRN